MNKDIPTHIETIMVSLLSGYTSQEEVEKLKQWIDKSPSHMAIWEHYRSTHRMIKAQQQAQHYPAVRTWGNTDPKSKRRYILDRLQATRLIKHFRKWAKTYRRVAAIVVAFAVGMALMFLLTHDGKKQNSDNIAEYSVPYGSKAKVTLPDFTVVWLNSGSTLHYSSSYNKTDREVYVEGEAYFQVARHPEIPFIVTTPVLSLKALGTNFNLKAYPDETYIEVTVASGLLQIFNGANIQQMGDLVLRPDQKATIKKVTDDQPEASIIVSDDIDTELYTCWKDKHWRIKEESLESLAVRLKRRYNVQISFADEKIKNYLFTGTLEDTTLEQALEAIKLSTSVNYQVKGDQVTLFDKQNRQKR